MTAQEIKVWIIPVGQQSVTIDDLVKRLAKAQWPPVAGIENEDFDQSFKEFSAHPGIKGELLEAAKKGLLTVFDSRTGGPLTLSKNEEFPPGALVKVADLPAYLATRLNGLRVALATAGVETPDSAQSVQPATQAAPAALTPSPPSEAVTIEPAPAAAHEWKELARVEARRIRKAAEANGWFPNLKKLGDEVAKVFNQKKYVGPNGHAMSGAHITRNALQGNGITKLADKLRSTMRQRGK